MFQMFQGDRQYQYVGAFLNIGMHPTIWGIWHSAVLNHYGCSTYTVNFFLKPIKRDKFVFKKYSCYHIIWTLFNVSSYNTLKALQWFKSNVLIHHLQFIWRCKYSLLGHIKTKPQKLIMLSFNWLVKLVRIVS